ncbi:DegT/DnrJ/EryC1/StrS aminotransferase family protein [uncultured Phycicoccus sp.]|uniref:DegT/DnrJ/EryC1/StrS family aminotransferase n=1 Tax=uncultured Phycicoccus sp. TaxID=661422 RepID=UPI002630CF4E|nr:DegT/DnrJ/EryC1/StrS family aminotransferase [uncultured Phycicoccus sp.]
MNAVIPHAKPLFGPEEEEAVLRVLRSGRLAQGAEVAAFETEFSAHFEIDRECVAVNSGTSGLHLALLALGIGAGDDVLVPSFTFAATANAVAMVGARPVFVDIDLDTYCMSPDAARAATTGSTRAMIPVHLYGHPAPMGALLALAREQRLLVIEDAAQAHGASIGQAPVGTFGDAAVFSFYPTKNMTTGEGGMVTVADPGVARKVRLLRNQGMEVRYRNEIAGLNNRMTDLNAAIGRVQLTKVDAWTERRRTNASYYDEHLRGVTTPRRADGVGHVYHQYTVAVPSDRDRFAADLQDRYGVETGVFYPVPVHRLPAFAVDADLPATDRAAAHCLSLPVHPALSEADLHCVVSAVNQLALEADA